VAVDRNPAEAIDHGEQAMRSFGAWPSRWSMICAGAARALDHREERMSRAVAAGVVLAFALVATVK
jgi:hypothetical protein